MRETASKSWKYRGFWGFHAFMGFVGMVHEKLLRFELRFEGAPAGPIWRRPAKYNGLTRFGTSSGDRAFGLVIANWEGGLCVEPLLVRFCGRPLLCRHSRSRWAFSRGF